MDSYLNRMSSGSRVNPTSRAPPADPDAWMRSKNPVPRPLYPSIVAWPYLHGNPFERPVDPYYYYRPRFAPQLSALRELNLQERRSFQEMKSIFELARRTGISPIRDMAPQPETLYPNSGRVRRDNNDEVPAYKIPPEILEQIFMKFLEDGDQDVLEPSHPLVSRKCPEDPLILGQVCSYWRSVALATPDLWCRIVVINPIGCHAVLADIWLERAGTRPLELTLEEKVDSKSLFSARSTLNLFGLRRQYWKDVNFQITGTSLEGLWSFGIDPPFAYLQSFSVSLLEVPSYFDHEHEAREFSNLWRRLYECPSLRRLHWAGPSLNSLQITRGLWNNVKDLTLDFPLTLEEGLDLLARSPMLEVVSPFRLSSLGLAEVPSSPPISCANLHTLNITAGVDTELLFASITLPALRNLSIRHPTHGDTAGNRPQLQDFLLRSECHLQKFTLIDPVISEDSVKSLLRLAVFDNLLGLRLSMTLTDNLVGFLTLNTRHGIGGPLPLLKTLYLSTCDTTDGMLAQMILSRWSSDSGRHLTKLTVYKGVGSSYGLNDSFTLARVFAEGLQGNYS